MHVYWMNTGFFFLFFQEIQINKCRFDNLWCGMRDRCINALKSRFWDASEKCRYKPNWLEWPQSAPVLWPFSTPCQIITPLVEIAIWLPNPNPSPTPNPKPTNTRGVIIWQGSELGTTPVPVSEPWCATDLCRAESEWTRSFLPLYF